MLEGRSRDVLVFSENLQRDFSLLALRPSAVLMNGVVKVYSRQIVYLLGEICIRENDAKLYGLLVVTRGPDIRAKGIVVV